MIYQNDYQYLKHHYKVARATGLDKKKAKNFAHAMLRDKELCISHLKILN